MPGTPLISLGHRARAAATPVRWRIGATGGDWSLPDGAFAQPCPAPGGDPGERLRQIHSLDADLEAMRQHLRSLAAEIETVARPPAGPPRLEKDEALAEAALDDVIGPFLRGCHLCAARGLLGWSMSDLAAASGLSLSTIRRLEDDGEAANLRSRRLAVLALLAAGIGFTLVDDRLAVYRT